MTIDPQADALLAEIQTNVERWIAAVTTDGSLSGAAAQGCRHEIDRLATDLLARCRQLETENREVAELKAIINNDGSLSTHEDHIDILRDAMHALSKLGAIADVDEQNRKLSSDLQAARAEVARLQGKLPKPYEKFVRVANELVAELKAAPSEPVTAQIEERDGGELSMIFTRHDCPKGVGVVQMHFEPPPSDFDSDPSPHEDKSNG